VPSETSPILVLDSGLGGLTVVRSLRQHLPAEDLIYFGDTARLPYGSKSASTVTTFVTQIIRYLLPLNPKHVILACNTATALSLSSVRSEFPSLAISGVIDPGSDAAVDAVGNKETPHIGVIATEATIRSQAYDRAILRRRPGAILFPQPAPLLVPIIEEGRDEADPLVRLAIEQYLKPMAHHDLDALVLGCTHYPILRRMIQQTLGSRTPVVDSADGCAQDVARRLAAAGLRRTVDQPTLGSLLCWVTDDSPKFARLASRFLGYDIPRPALVSPDELPTSSPTDALRQAI
jgi:glutamate racemase